MSGEGIEHLLELLVSRGGGQYGYEPVSQLAHALQTASLAEAAGEGAPLVAAALLHDLGHLVDGSAVERLARGEDDHHELRALRLLKREFGAAVVEPVRLHVQAKRYLCAAEPGYLAALSEASRASLAVQGGAMSADEAAAFIRLPQAEAALRLRRYDDRAKSPSARSPEAHYFLRHLRLAQAETRMPVPRTDSLSAQNGALP